MKRYYSNNIKNCGWWNITQWQPQKPLYVLYGDHKTLVSSIDLLIFNNGPTLTSHSNITSHTKKTLLFYGILFYLVIIKYLPGT